MKGVLTMKRLSLLAVLLLFLATSPLYAAPPIPDNGVIASGQAAPLAAVGPQAAVPVDGLWQEFYFAAVGTWAEACNGRCGPSSAGNSEDAGDPPWTFTAGCAGVNLMVTDAFLSGDMFEMFDFGTSIGVTSLSYSGASCGDDPEVCRMDSNMSHQIITLAPGDHSITITPTASPYGTGAAYFRVIRLEPDDDDCDGVPNNADLCAGTKIPEGVPTVRLGVNRWALVDSDGYFDTVLPAGKGPERSYSIWDTGGCSCEQIIAAMGLGAGHTMYGCSISAMDAWIAGMP
jgi:hypothetical protein